MKNCVRCNDMSVESEIGKALLAYVCDRCRSDANVMHLGHDSTVETMNYQLPNEK